MAADEHRFGVSEGAADDRDLVALRRRLEQAVARVCPRWMLHHADDIVQVSMLRVLEVVRKDEQRRSFNASYLYRVAYSALVDELRRARWRHEVPLEGTDDASKPSHPSAEAGPESRAAGREVGEAIAACMRTLIPSRRRAVLLHLHGHSAAESAALLGQSLKQVRNLIYRGIADLRACLRKKGVEP